MASTINAKNTSTGVVITPDASGQLELQTADTTRMTITSSGNVGIGTTSPTQKLQVVDSSTSANTLLVESGQTGTTAGSNVIARFQSNAVGRDATIQFSDNVANSSTISMVGGATAFRQNGVESMRIDSSGNVIVGGTSAVYGAANRGVLTINGASQALLGFTVGAADKGFLYHAGTDMVLSNTAAGFLGFQTNNTERMRIASNGYVTNAVNGLGNGLVQAQQYYRLNSGLAGANVNTVQSMFGVGVTLVGSTVYEFEIMVMLAKTAGTTSHSIGLSFGGTATINNIGYSVLCGFNTVVNAGGALNASIITTASNTSITPATTSAAVYVPAIIKGTVSVNAGGTFIPQYTLSAAPGGAYTVQAGSYIKISPLSASGSNTSIGSWA